MNNYSRRSQFYRYEFITEDDFPLIQYVLGAGDGSVIEIPCGAGRLLNVHSKHKREVYMVDLEPTMVEKCRHEIVKKDLSPRLCAVVGNMINWRSPKKVELVLMPRGGLQLLATQDEIHQALTNSSQNLIKNGSIFIDIADPWSSSPKEQSLLPEFMRFQKSRILRGKTDFKINADNVLSRSYISVRYKTYISVHFKFKVNSDNQTAYEENYRWSRVNLNDLVAYLSPAGFVIKKLYGDYSFRDYQSSASRIICIAQKEE